MRTIREMLANDEKVWVYIRSRETWERFAEMAENEGFGFGDLPRKSWACGYVVAVHKDGKLGHLPLFVWCTSFSSNSSGSPRKIDFGKYMNYEEYECRVPHFKGMMV